MEIEPSYTSQTCPRCGHVSKRNWRGYVYFRCVECGYEADRDRVASLNIAERATRIANPKGRIPLGGAPVKGHVWRDEGCETVFKPPPPERVVDRRISEGSPSAMLGLPPQRLPSALSQISKLYGLLLVALWLILLSIVSLVGSAQLLFSSDIVLLLCGVLVSSSTR